MKKPILSLCGIDHEFPKLKAKHWRLVLKHQEDRATAGESEVIALSLALIADCFDIPGLTVNALDEKIEFADILPLRAEIIAYVISVATSKLNQVPNVEAAITE